MLIRFCCITYSKPNQRLAVIGNIAELGLWKLDSALSMRPIEGVISELIPSIWFVDVDIAMTSRAKMEELSFEYKFIRWISSSGCKPYRESGQYNRSASTIAIGQEPFNFYQSPSPIVDPWTKEAIFLDKIIVRNNTVDVSLTNNLEWEGSGSMDNRIFKYDKINIVSLGSYESTSIHSTSIYIIPPSHFIESGGPHISELQHTTRYYSYIKNIKSMHYDRILANLYCGGTPRLMCHIRHLKEDLGITCVMNLQTIQDAMENYPAEDRALRIEDRTVTSIYELYESHDIAYIWLPTEDMQTEARSHQVAQAAFLIQGLLANGHNVYVHCNAGVGRSVMACCSVLVCCLRLPLRHAYFIMNSRRPVAFWDEVAMKHGAIDFDKKFGEKVSKCKYSL